MAGATKENLAAYLATKQQCRVSQAATVVETVLGGVLVMLNEHGRIELRGFGTFVLDPGGKKRRRYSIAVKQVVETKTLPKIHFQSSPCLFQRRRGMSPRSLFEALFE